MATMDEVRGWFAGRLPSGWFTEPPEITADRDEILVVGRLAEPSQVPKGGLEEAQEARIQRFREETRRERMAISVEAQRRFGVAETSWGAVCGDLRRLFTTQSVPVMTRLRLPERKVLDTLVEGGVARSRSDALAWCVRLVARNEEDWLGKLREALRTVEEARATGPA